MYKCKLAGNWNQEQSWNSKPGTLTQNVGISDIILVLVPNVHVSKYKPIQNPCKAAPHYRYYTGYYINIRKLYVFTIQETLVNVTKVRSTPDYPLKCESVSKCLKNSEMSP